MNWISCLVFSFSLSLALISSTVFASHNTVQNLYSQLTEIKNLNTPENTKKMSSIMDKIQSSEFDHIRAPFYAYNARLQTRIADFSQANNLLKKAVNELSKLDDNELLIDTLDYISWVHFNRGNYAQAIGYIKKMIHHAFKTHNRRGQTLALARLGLNYLELDVNELAFSPLETALRLARENNDKSTEYLALLYLINARIDFPKLSVLQTMDLVKQADNIGLAINDNNGYLYRLKGIVYQQLENVNQAKYWLEKALVKAKDDNDIRLQRITYKSLAEFYLETRQLDQAQQSAIESFTLAEKLSHYKSKADLHLILSKIYDLKGNKEKTLHHLSHYADFITSNSTQNIISLLTIIDKELDYTKQQEKINSLENQVISAQQVARKSHHKQYITFISILIVTFAFIILTIVYYIRTRILSMKVALSMKDALTGAFGRSYLQHYLPGAKARFQRTLADKESFGVIAIDCDDFKLINEQFGHAGGDTALKGIVVSLMEQIRTNDHLFRWGGDEFVLMCEHVSQHQLSEIAQRLTQAVNCLSIDYDGKNMKPTISVGYALHSKDDEFDLGRLLKQADKFLYQTKRTGKNNFLGSYI